MPLIFLHCKPKWYPPEDVLVTKFTPEEMSTFRLATHLQHALVNALWDVDRREIPLDETLVDFRRLHPRAINACDLLVFVHPPEINDSFDAREARRADLRDAMLAYLKRRFGQIEVWPEFDLEVIPLSSSGYTVASNGRIKHEWGTPK